MRGGEKMGETEFRLMCEDIKTGITQLRAERSRAAAVTGFLEGTEKRDPGLTYSTDQVIRLIELICPEIE